jgi:hypothetical protein
MGNHYIPQKYLLRFADDKGCVWGHDKVKQNSFHSGVRGIAHEINMYSDEVETALNVKVEMPSHGVFDKILARQNLSDADRKVLAKYMVVMRQRVPTGRQRSLNLLPSVADAVQSQIAAEFNDLRKVDPSNPTLDDSIRWVNEYIEKVKESPPVRLWYDSIDLTEQGPVEAALLSMNWVFLHSEGLQYLTSDNPVFFTESEGLLSPTAEFTFPISDSIALWGTRQNQRNDSHITTLTAAVKQINRRTAARADRFVFSRQNEDWIMPFITKGEWELTRLGRG